MGIFSDLKRHQELKPHRKYGLWCHHSKDIDLEHIPGIINPSDMFTKEMKDNTHFRNIKDSMMVSLQSFLKYSHNILFHIISVQKFLHIIPYGQST